VDCIRRGIKDRNLMAPFRSDETAETEILLDDDIINCRHDETDLCGISGTCEMCVDLLALMLVKGDEAVQDVVASRAIVITTIVVGEVVLHWADGKLLLEPIDLVEEKNDRGLDEPPGVADGIEKGKSFLHTVDRLVFEKQLVVLGNSDQKENGRDVLEAVNPLLTLRSLATNIEHSVCELADNESRLGNTSRLDTRPQDILVVGHVIRGSNTGNVVEVVSRRVVQLVFS
jgi:hypothetical protein